MFFVFLPGAREAAASTRKDSRVAIRNTKRRWLVLVQQLRRRISFYLKKLINVI